MCFVKVQRDIAKFSKNRSFIVNYMDPEYTTFKTQPFAILDHSWSKIQRHTPECIFQSKATISEKPDKDIGDCVIRTVGKIMII